MNGAAKLVRFASSGVPRRRLVCLPFAGGTAATYRLWPSNLPDDVEVQFVQLPGRDMRGTATPLDSIEAMVEAVLPALDEIDDLPFAVFGHSLGALVAFEVTVALERSERRTPDHLFVSSRRPPDAVDGSGQRLAHEMDDDEFVRIMKERYDAIPDVVASEPDLLSLLLPLLRADVKAFETYRPLADHRVATPLHVFGGSDDTRPRPEHLDGWQRFAAGPVAFDIFPGGHFYLNDARPALVATLARRWDRGA